MRAELAKLWGNFRNALAMGVITSVNDSGGAKVANLQTGMGAARADVEVLDTWGFSAVPPSDGIIGLVVAMGGDPANLRVIGLGNPSARFGGLLTGETVMFAGDSSRVHIRQGGIVDIWGGAQVNIHTKGCTINAPLGCTINGNVTVNGNLTATGNMSDSHGSLDRLRQNYDAHSHPSLGAPPNLIDPE